MSKKKKLKKIIAKAKKLAKNHTVNELYELFDKAITKSRKKKNK